MLHLAFLAAAKAAASCGRLSSASAPFPVSNSAYSSMMLKRLGRGKALDCCPLRLNAEPRALLLLRGNSKICDGALHTNGIRMAFGQSTPQVNSGSALIDRISPSIG